MAILSANAEFIYFTIAFLILLLPLLTFRVIKTLSSDYILRYMLIINMLLPYVCSQSNFAILDFSALVVAKTITVLQAQVCMHSH